jgi:hypothetical protein
VMSEEAAMLFSLFDFPFSISHVPSSNFHIFRPMAGRGGSHLLDMKVPANMLLKTMDGKRHLTQTRRPLG